MENSKIRFIAIARIGRYDSNLRMQCSHQRAMVPRTTTWLPCTQQKALALIIDGSGRFSYLDQAEAARRQERSFRELPGFLAALLHHRGEASHDGDARSQPLRAETRSNGFREIQSSEHVDGASSEGGQAYLISREAFR